MLLLVASQYLGIERINPGHLGVFVVILELCTVENCCSLIV